MTAALIFLGFFPFGEVVGDSIGPRLDAASMLIGTLEVPIVYNQEEWRVISVKHMYITMGMQLKESY